jgi:hypothetical protein
VAVLKCPGLLVVGDYALATGADSHVAHVAQRLASARVAIASVSMIPADRIALAAAIHRAWTHCDWVVSFGGLGDASDDHVRATVAALQTGRVDVGLPRLPERLGDGFLECGNVVFFPGRPDHAHPAFDAWLAALQVRGDKSDLGTGQEKNSEATEFVGWTLPESAQTALARATVKRDYPAVMQRVMSAGDGRVTLRFTGASRSRTQAARKALQRLLAGP